MVSSVSRFSVQHISVIACIYWNSGVFVLLRTGQLFSAAGGLEGGCLWQWVYQQACSLADKPHASLGARAVQPQEILANFFLLLQQQAVHQHLPARFFSFFLGAIVLGEASGFFVSFWINSHLHFYSSVSDLTPFLHFLGMLLGVRFFSWASLLPEFWSVCRYRFHLQALRRDPDKGEKS